MVSVMLSDSGCYLHGCGGGGGCGVGSGEW